MQLYLRDFLFYQKFSNNDGRIKGLQIIRNSEQNLICVDFIATIVRSSLFQFQSNKILLQSKVEFLLASF
jgi:hypothetical protein